MKPIINQDYKSINARILNTERIYGKESQIVQRIYDTLERAYGVKGITRFRKYNPKEVSYSRELQIARAYKQVDLSKYTSREGRQSIRTNWERSFKSNHEGWSDAQIGRAMDVFTNVTNWERIRELVGEYGSDRVLEMITHSNDNDIDNEQLDQFLNAYFKNTDYSSQHDNINKEIMDFMLEDSEGRDIYIQVLSML